MKTNIKITEKAYTPLDMSDCTADQTATFWWYMKLNPDQKRPWLVGYGKFEGMNEGKSEDQTLCRIIKMLHRNNWFSKASEINIHKRADVLCQKSDPIIMQITMGEIVYFGISPTVRAFLNNFSNLYNNGIKPKVHLIPSDNYKRNNPYSPGLSNTYKNF